MDSKPKRLPQKGEGEKELEEPIRLVSTILNRKLKELAAEGWFPLQTIIARLAEKSMGPNTVTFAFNTVGWDKMDGRMQEALIEFMRQKVEAWDEEHKEKGIVGSL
jgi:hypothetical protein